MNDLDIASQYWHWDCQFIVSICLLHISLYEVQFHVCPEALIHRRVLDDLRGHREPSEVQAQLLAVNRLVMNHLEDLVPRARRVIVDLFHNPLVVLLLAPRERWLLNIGLFL